MAELEAALPRPAGWQALTEPGSHPVADTFDVFDRNAELVNVMRSLRASGVRNEASYTRTDQLRAMVSSIDGIPDEAVDQLVGLIRLLSASDGWARLTEPDLGLGAAQAGEAAEWAIRVLVAAARREAGPLGARHDD